MTEILGKLGYNEEIKEKFRNEKVVFVCVCVCVCIGD